MTGRRHRKPKFSRHPKLKRVEGSWRRPKGSFNKKRLEKKGKLPKIGYGSKKSEKFLHPSGKMEVLVENVKNLENIDNKKECIRIRSSVGKKKRAEIIKKAEEMKIKILN